MSQAPHTTARPVLTHTLGFPRMGARRALKFALESHWRGDSTARVAQAADCAGDQHAVQAGERRRVARPCWLERPALGEHRFQPPQRIGDF